MRVTGHSRALLLTWYAFAAVFCVFLGFYFSGETNCIFLFCTTKRFFSGGGERGGGVAVLNLKVEERKMPPFFVCFGSVGTVSP